MALVGGRFITEDDGVGEIQPNLEAFLNNQAPEGHAYMLHTSQAPSPCKTTTSELTGLSHASSHSPQSVMLETECRAQYFQLPGPEQDAEESSSMAMAMVRVRIDTDKSLSTFSLPLSLLLQREAEMQTAAEQAQIPTGQWSGSRLYHLWKDATDTDTDTHTRSSNNSNSNNRITLHLTPEQDAGNHILATASATTRFVWDPWLTTSLQNYYRTGTFVVPDHCQGHEVLAALEYCGILTVSPKTFAFDSMPAYHRIQSWSSYLVQKERLADWIQEHFQQTKTDKDYRHAWVATAHEDETSWRLQVKDSAQAQTSILEGPNQTPEALHQLFADSDSDEPLTRQVPIQLRLDFAACLQSRLDDQDSKYKVAFQMQAVHLCRLEPGGDSVSVSRPVLTIADTSCTTFQTPRTPVPSDESSSTHWRKSLKPKRLQYKFADMETIRLGKGFSSKKIEYFHPYGSEEDLDDSLRARHSTFQMTAIEQRQRNSPSPQGHKHSNERRLSPETVIDVSTNQTKKTMSGQAAVRAQKISVPIGILNTDYGDLRSVTSGLSDPYMDGESTIRDHSTLDPSTVYSKRTRASRISSTKDEAKHNLPTVQEDQHVGEQFASQAPDTVNTEAEGSDNEAPPPSYWDSFLAGICEAIIPGDSINNRAKSPIREITIPSVKDPNEGGKEWLEGCRVDSEKVIEGCRVPVGVMSKDSTGVVKAAKIVGTRLSQSIDEIVCIALDEEETDDEDEAKRMPAPDAVGAHRGKAQTTLPRARSAPLRKSTRHALVETQVPTKRASTYRRPPSRPKSNPSPHLRATRANKQGVSRQMRSAHRSVPKTNVSKTDIFGAPVAFGQVQLPPRDPRRERPRSSRSKITRKKSTSPHPKTWEPVAPSTTTGSRLLSSSGGPGSKSSGRRRNRQLQLENNDEPAWDKC